MASHRSARFVGLWRHADFRKLWAGQTVSQFGSQISVLALPLTAALTLHAGAAEMGLLAAAGNAPFLLFGLFVGVWVDRVPRRPILMIADFGRFALLLVIPLLALLGALTITYLYVIAFLVGVFTVFFEVAYQSYLPSLVGRPHLIEGNGKLEMTRSAAQIAGPSVAGALVQVMTAPVAIVMDALSFLVSVLFLGLIRTPERAPARVTERHIVAEIGEGLRTLTTNAIIRAIVASMGVVNMFGSMVFAVLVLYATRTLGISAGLLGLAFALGNVGWLVGALVVRRASERFGPGPTVIVGCAICTLAWVFVPLASGPLWMSVPVLIVAQFLRAFGGTLFNVSSISVRQAITPDHLLGRVNATVRFIGTGALPIGSLAGGTLGAVLGVRPTLWIGALGGLVAVIWPLCSPLRTLRTQPTLAETTEHVA